MSIMTHPLVQDPQIYYPGTENEVVLIERGRLFGGVELIEPGLTVSVHPYHSAFDVLKGTPTRGTTASVLYDKSSCGRDTLATESEFERGYNANIHLVVQLYYRDPGLNVPTTLSADVLEARCSQDRRYHGHSVRFYEESVLQNTFSDSKELPYKFQLEVQTLPGEEILTQWLDLLKDVIRDIKFMHPFTQYRNPYISRSDYPTTTWLAKSGNLVFHTAYHIVEFDVAEPPRTFHSCIPPVQSVTVVNNIELG